MDVFEKFCAFVQEEELLKSGERVVVGVSGGPDSLCLLELVHRFGAVPIVAHLDHQLRQESASEAEFVREISLDRGLTFELGEAQFEAEQSGSLEEHARLARYRFLAQVARKHSVGKLAVGHTYDDQVESILMHFLRGAGPAGLRGMLPATEMSDWVGVPGSAGLTIVRPLLPVTHAETLVYCEQVGLEPRFDRSNLDLSFFRNRLRHHLLPILEQYNPGVRKVIHRLGEIMRAEVDYLREQVDTQWHETVLVLSADALIIRVGALRVLPLALQRGLVRRAISELRPDMRDLGYENVERALRYALRADRPASAPVIDDLLVHDFGMDVLLAPEGEIPALPDYPQVIDPVHLGVPLPGEVALANRWRILINEHREIDVPGVTEDADSWDVFLDRGKLANALVIRGRQPGDRIQPLGMQGSMKVSDLMINRKIPHLARERWPLLVSAGEVAWVPGLHLGHPFRVTEDTERVLRMQVLPPG